MVHAREDTLKDEDVGLLDFLSASSDSDGDINQLTPVKREMFAEIEPEISFNSHFPNILVIAGLPCVSEEKYDKLKNAAYKRIFSAMLQKGVYDPIDPSEQSSDKMYPFTIHFATEKKGDGSFSTSGMCFVIFNTEGETKKALQCLKNHGMDVKHPFYLELLDDFDSLLTDDGASKIPKEAGFTRSDLRDWLCDPLSREQYAYRCGSISDVMWFDAIEKEPKNAYVQEEKLGSALCWSPLGSYLITFHKQGIWLRGGSDFEKKVSFNHAGVKYILFSPNEEYLITWDGSNTQTCNEESVIIWHLFSGKKLKTCPTPQFSTTGVRTDDGGAWPLFFFSPDSKYLAMRRERDIAIYETQTMLLLRDTSAQGGNERCALNCAAEQFQWSPTDNILSIWISEDHDSPGRLLLVDIPSRQEISSKNVFSVKSVSMFWHPHGEFLALCTVIARKKGKKTKKETTQIEIFRVKDKSIPVDTINLEDARVICLRWELGKNTSRFATLTVNDATSARSINFYNVPTKGSKQDTELVGTLALHHPVDTFEWSPAGQYFLTASQGSDGTLIFGCLNESNHVEVIQKATQFESTDIFWDPSGRYVATAVLVHPGTTNYRITSNAGFQIYSFLGRLLYKLQDEKACQFLWRPRPPTLLSSQKIAEVHKKLKEYSKIYDMQDDLRRQARNNALRQETTGKMEFFTQCYKEAQDWLHSHPCAAEWEKAQEEFNTYMGWYEKTVTWDEVIDVTREVVKKQPE